MLIIRQQQLDQLAKGLLKNDEEGLIVEIKEPSIPTVPIGKGLLCVRAEQMKVFQTKALCDFEDELSDYFKKKAVSRQWAVSSDEAIRETVRNGINRAQKYGFTKRGPVRFFVELMLTFGSEFDTDPLLPWAEGVLNNESIKDQVERAGILREAMREYLAEMPGGRGKEFVRRNAPV